MTDRGEWLTWRREGITATDVAKALSGRYGGMRGVLAEKRGESQEVTAAMLRGQRWEERITTAAETLTGFAIVGEQSMIQAADNPAHRATIDGFLAPVDIPEPSIDDVLGVLEVKTREEFTKPAWDYWSTQVQWQLHCAGLDFVVLAEAVIDDTTDEAKALKITRIERDQVVIDQLVEVAEEIARHITDGTMPDPEGEEAYAIAMDSSIEQWRVDNSEVVDLSSLADDVRRRNDVKQAVASAERELKEIDARIIEALGGASKGECDGFTVTLSKPRATVTPEAEAELLASRPDLGKTVLDRELAKQDKDLWQSLQTPSGARTLTVKGTT